MRGQDVSHISDPVYLMLRRPLKVRRRGAGAVLLEPMLNPDVSGVLVFRPGFPKPPEPPNEGVDDDPNPKDSVCPENGIVFPNAGAESAVAG